MERIKECWWSFAKLVGHRGAFLTFLAFLDLIIAYSIFTIPEAGTPFLIPYNVWGGIWAAAGVILITGIFRSHDQFQFGVAAFVKSLWAVAWLRLWIIKDVPNSWVNFVVWTAFAAIVVIVSTWPEVRRRPKPPMPLDSIEGEL